MGLEGVGVGLVQPRKGIRREVSIRVRLSQAGPVGTIYSLKQSFHHS